MTVEFSVDHNDTVADDAGIEQLVGWVTATVETKPGNYRVRDLGGPTPRALKLAPRRGWLAANGHMYKDETLAAPFRLVANDPAFNLRELTYRFDFDLTTLVGVPVSIPFCRGPAPSTDTTLYLARLMNTLDQPVIEVRTKGYAEDILDAGTVGAEVVRSNLTTDAQDAMAAASDVDFRLSDRRVPVDKSVDLSKLADALAVVLAVASTIDPEVLRLGHSSTADATQVEVWANGARILFWNSGGEHVDANVTVGSDTTAATRKVVLDTAAGQSRVLEFDTAGLARWLFFVGTGAESGTAVGADFVIRSCNNDGTARLDVISINRNTGVVTFAGSVITPASVTGGAGFRLPPGVAPTSPTDGDVWITTTGLFARINGVTKAYGTDANNNMSADVFVTGATGVVTSGGTTTLTANDTGVQEFTGTGGTVKMPTTGVTQGWPLLLLNNSSGTLIIQASDASEIIRIDAGKFGWFWAGLATPTASTNWKYFSPNSSQGSRFNTAVQRDADAYVNGSGFTLSATTTVSANSTTTLTRTSGQKQVVTGTADHAFKLPTTNVTIGDAVEFISQTTGTVTIQSSGANTIDTIAAPSGGQLGRYAKYVAVAATPTTATGWQRAI